MPRAFINGFLRIRTFNKIKYVSPKNYTNYSNFHTSATASYPNPVFRFLKFGIPSTVLLGLGFYVPFRHFFPNLYGIPLEEIDEDSFDSKDNLVVAILNSKKMKNYPKEEIELLKSALPKGVKLYYTVKKSPNQEGVRVMFCKGMRKKYYPLVNLSYNETFKDLKEDLKWFFEPISQDVSSLNDEKWPEFVSHNNFKTNVIDAAREDSPILVQMFEDTCFLCFLIRPFINSVNKHLKETGNPLKIKRLNIDLNDFPKGCPVTRATPTFVYFSGSENGTKWEEFKPQEFVQKLSKVANLSEESKTHLEELSERITERFMLFGKLAQWLSETQKMQELMFKQYSEDYELTNDEDMYSRSINVLMDIDMKRTDCLEENLESLNIEIESAEKDCIAMGQILAEELIKSGL